MRNYATQKTMEHKLQNAEKERKRPSILGKRSFELQVNRNIFSDKQKLRDPVVG